MVTEIEKAAQAVAARYGTVHAFCRAHPDLNRTTVYQVLRGTYAGNTARQLGRIMAALEAAGDDVDLPSLAEVEECIRQAACQRCPVDQGADLCKRCAPTHLLQAQAVLELLQIKRGGK